MMKASDIMTEEVAKEISRAILVGLDELHQTNTAVVTLNPWNIKFNKNYALFLDVIWCISRQITKVNCSEVESKFLQYYGTPSSISS